MPSCLALALKLNSSQWRVVRQLTFHIDTWNDCSPVGPEQMGRAAAKVEAVEEVLQKLWTFASSTEVGLRNYGKGSRFCFSEDESVREKGLFGASVKSKCVGSMQHTQAPLVKQVEPERLKFWKSPSFDPSPFPRRPQQRNLSFSFGLLRCCGCCRASSPQS